MGEKHEVDIEKVIQTDEKSQEASGTTPVDEEHEEENSKIDAVRLVVPVTDNIDLVCITFRFWVLSLFF
ncbi:hypothetical protein BGX33_003435 [Mortierella sp. NVP41]|nr:hypothetical protein BGX33_003435 [Mortierella sp. NVP41]